MRYSTSALGPGYFREELRDMRRLQLFAVLCVVAGCATGETLDGVGGGATGGTGGCASGEKSCGGICIKPSPGVGCGPTDCTPCPAVPNATSTCVGSLCDFDCISGYVKSGNSCVLQGGGGTGGGSGGGGGTGGSTGCAAPCDPSQGASQAVCIFYCTLQTGSPGICAPFFNCCTC